MNLPLVLRNASALERWRKRTTGSLGFVPTMGALHRGHLSLVQRARRENPRVVVSIFVNPTQFGPKEDFKRYPRDLPSDLALLAAVPGAVVYAPALSEIYPKDFVSKIQIGGALGQVLDAKWRPGHFDGVATVVARFFALVKPDQAYFGLKDYQQYLVIRRMALDFALPLKVKGCPIVRELDGLALSSRNQYLDSMQRTDASALIRALRMVKTKAAGGERNIKKLESFGRQVLKKTKGLKVQYLSIADAHTLEPLQRLDRKAIVLTACLLGHTRLIDNLSLGSI